MLYRHRTPLCQANIGWNPIWVGNYDYYRFRPILSLLWSRSSSNNMLEEIMILYSSVFWSCIVWCWCRLVKSKRFDQAQGYLIRFYIGTDVLYRNVSNKEIPGFRDHCWARAIRWSWKDFKITGRNVNFLAPDFCLWIIGCYKFGRDVFVVLCEYATSRCVGFG